MVCPVFPLGQLIIENIIPTIEYVIICFNVTSKILESKYSTKIELNKLITSINNCIPFSNPNNAITTMK